MRERLRETERESERERERARERPRERAGADLDVDALLGFLAVEETLDVEVGAAGVLVNGRAHPLPLARDDHIGVRSCRGGEGGAGDRSGDYRSPRTKSLV